MADTFLAAVKEVCDGVAGISPVMLDQRPEDMPQLPADVIIHLGQVPTHFSTCLNRPTYVDDRFEVIVYRESLPVCEQAARALMEAWNQANLAFDGVERVKLFRENYQAGLAVKSDGSPMRTSEGQAVYRASIQYLAQYAPAF